MKKLRPPQLDLRFDAGLPDAAERWCDGAAVTYLGRSIRLQLDTDRRAAILEGDTLHLPLPPEASPRQIRDAAEAWLRKEAQQLLGAAAMRHVARLGVSIPQLKLSFASRGSWVEVEGSGLRCNWRLIEQPEAAIDQALARAIAGLAVTPQPAQDLFGAFA